MDKIKESLSIYDFLELFPDSESCLKYLFNKKWEHGYRCRNCGNEKHFKGRKDYNLRCTSCGYEESPTAHTLFHKVKFSLEKAFFMIYFLAVMKKGMASTQMDILLDLQQKTCWKFKLKVMHAMKSSKRYKMCGNVDLLIFPMGINHVQQKDEIVEKKKQVVIARESQGARRSWMYGQFVDNLSKDQLEIIFRDHLDKNAKIITNGCRGYVPLNGVYKRMERLLPVKNKMAKQPKGKRNFKPNKGVMLEAYRRSMGLLYEVRGTYGHAEFVQAYMDEYFFRLNRCDMSSGKIFEHLLDRMINHCQMSYKNLVIYMDKAGRPNSVAQNPTPT